MKKIALLAPLCAVALGMSLIGCANDTNITNATDGAPLVDQTVLVEGWSLTNFSKEITKGVGEGKTLHFKVKKNGSNAFNLTVQSSWWTVQEGVSYKYEGSICKSDKFWEGKNGDTDVFTKIANSQGFIDLYYTPTEAMKEVLTTTDEKKGPQTLSLLGGNGSFFLDASSVELVDTDTISTSDEDNEDTSSAFSINGTEIEDSAIDGATLEEDDDGNTVLKVTGNGSWGGNTKITLPETLDLSAKTKCIVTAKVASDFSDNNDIKIVFLKDDDSGNENMIKGASESYSEVSVDLPGWQSYGLTELTASDFASITKIAIYPQESKGDLFIKSITFE